MNIEHDLRVLQDNLRNSGWRIKHIPWQKDGKPEYYGNTLVSLVMIIVGLGAFFCGILFIVSNICTIVDGITISIAGLLSLLASRVMAGYMLYKNYVAIDAQCLDIDIQEFEYADPDLFYSFRKKTFWSPRILCEHHLDNQRWRVTPVITKQVFSSTDSALHFLRKRMDEERQCTLWVNPDNPLQTIFHKKPRIVVHS